MPKQNSPTQFDRFKSTARALECDDDKDNFEAALGKIAAHKPAKALPKKKKAIKKTS
ncbi:MAG: hypothetical protein ACLQIQ_12810 [Beijerinckiaceae bacterium]